MSLSRVGLDYTLSLLRMASPSSQTDTRAQSLISKIGA